MTWLQPEVVVVDGWELEICSNLPTSKPASIEGLLSCRRTFTRCKFQVYKALQQQDNMSNNASATNNRVQDKNRQGLAELQHAPVKCCSKMSQHNTLQAHAGLINRPGQA